MLNAKDLIPREVCEIARSYSNESDLQLLWASFGRQRQAQPLEAPHPWQRVDPDVSSFLLTNMLLSVIHFSGKGI